MYTELRKIRYAVTVAQTHSFTAAAEKLHVSQSSISEQIRLLEDSIGFKLFHRSTRGIEMTDPGRSFLQEAERVYLDAINLTETARRIRDGGEVFSIGIGSGLSAIFIERFLVEFRKTHLDIRLDLFTESTRRIYDDLHAERIDLGVAIETNAEKIPAGLIQVPFIETEMVLITPFDHALAALPSPVPIARIAETSLVMNELNVGYGEVVQSMFHDSGLSFDISAIADNIDTLASLVEQGIGVAIVPKEAVAEKLDQHRLHTANIAGTKRISICLVRRQRRMPENRESYYTFLREMA